MPRPFKVISCSSCGAEPANPRQARIWAVQYNKHHGYWPGYKNPESLKPAAVKDEEKPKGPSVSLSQFMSTQNPGLWALGEEPK